jgi:hypothetical protein
VSPETPVRSVGSVRIQAATESIVLDDDLVIAGDNLPVMGALPDGFFDLV